MKKIRIGDRKEGMTIRPELHSQFIEFLGSCIHDGIWVGKNSKIPNYDGLRKDTVDALRAIAPPVIRWPGGCYADMYHWRDGIGRERRTVWNENFGTQEAESNAFGTDEFMRFCEMIGARPWLNINMLRGTTEEAANWAEYCNRKENTALSAERAENGHPAPYHVEYWGIGNEAWGGGGTYTAQGYADAYRRYASAMPSFQNPFSKEEDSNTQMKLIAVGPDGNKPKERVKWTRDFFEALSQYRFPKIYGMDLHFYNWNLNTEETSETAFAQEDWDRVVRSCMEIENVIQEQYGLIQEGLAKVGTPDPDPFFVRPQCRLVIGEWGNWHRGAFTNRPALFQQCTMRDAITSAVTLNIYQRNCDKVDMACVAQTVNVLNSLILTEGDQTILTPNYYVFQMFLPYRGGTVLDLTCENDGKVDTDPFVFASEKDGIVTLNIINPSMTDEMEIAIEGADLCCLRGTVLCAENPNDCNTPRHPERILPRGVAPLERGSDGTFSAVLPAASIQVYQFQRGRKTGKWEPEKVRIS